MEKPFINMNDKNTPAHFTVDRGVCQIIKCLHISKSLAAKIQFFLIRCPKKQKIFSRFTTFTSQQHFVVLFPFRIKKSPLPASQ